METVSFNSSQNKPSLRLDKDYGADLEVLLGLVPDKWLLKLVKSQTCWD